ncbi:hypothetical protein [Leuconostoc citreum]
MITSLHEPRLETRPIEQVLGIMVRENQSIILVYKKGGMIKSLSQSEISFDYDNDVVVLNTRSIIKFYLMDILKGLKLFCFGSIILSVINMYFVGMFGAGYWLPGLIIWSCLVVFLAYILIGDIQNLLNLRNILLSKNDDELLDNFNYEKNRLLWLSFMVKKKQLLSEQIEMLKQKAGKDSDKLDYPFFKSANYLETLAHSVPFAIETDIFIDSQITKQAIESEIDVLTKYDDLQNIAEQLRKTYLNRVNEKRKERC